MLPGGNKISDLISHGATERDLMEYMHRSGHTLLIHDGIQKITSGTTTTAPCPPRQDFAVKRRPLNAAQATRGPTLLQFGCYDIP